MKSAYEASKILEKKDSHNIDGKQIQVMIFRGMDIHEKEFVAGNYKIKIESLFTPSENENTNDKLAYSTYQKLEDAFHEFEYTIIRIVREKNKFVGWGDVSFKDMRDKEAIMRKATNTFVGCDFEEYKIEKANVLSLGRLSLKS